MTDVRAITPNCSGLSRPNCEMVSSVRPSARYSLLGSPVRFSNGSTASMIFCDLGGALLPKCRQDAKQTAAKRAADAPTTATFRQFFGAFGTASSTEPPRGGCRSDNELPAVETWTAGCFVASVDSATVTP